MKKNIFYDFDGVLADSVNIKTEAFYKLYEPFGKGIAEKVVEHHLANGGVSRFEKIKHYHKSFLGIDLSEEEIQKWASTFSELVLTGVINSNEIEGVTYFLLKYKNKYKNWVISGTPTEELKVVVEKRHMNEYFVDVFGSPQKKEYWVNHIIQQHGLKKEECVFIGDATTDYEAAKATGIDFLLRTHPENEDYFKDKDVVKFSDFYELEKIMNQWQ